MFRARLRGRVLGAGPSAALRGAYGRPFGLAGRWSPPEGSSLHSLSPAPLSLSLSEAMLAKWPTPRADAKATANRFSHHRSLQKMADATDDRLRLLIERVERLEEEKKGIADDIRDVYAEAKAVGYDTKIMRQIVRLRKMKPDDRAEMEMVLETYKAALGLG